MYMYSKAVVWYVQYFTPTTVFEVRIMEKKNEKKQEKNFYVWFSQP